MAAAGAGMDAEQMQALQSLLDEPAREHGLLQMIDEDAQKLMGPERAARIRNIGAMPVQALKGTVGQLKELPGVSAVGSLGAKVGQAGMDGLKSGVTLGAPLPASLVGHPVFCFAFFRRTHLTFFSSPSHPGAEVMGKGVDLMGKGASLMADKTLEAASKGAGMVGAGIGVVAEKVLPQFAMEAAIITRDVAMERLTELGKSVEDMLKDPAWKQFARDARNSSKPGFKFWNYYRVQLFYVLITCTFLGGVILMHDPQKPDSLEDAIFMTARRLSHSHKKSAAQRRLPRPPTLPAAVQVSAMSGAGLTTIQMSKMSAFSLRITYFLMLAGGIAFLLVPPVLWRIYQYRRFKPMVQKVLKLRAVRLLPAADAAATPTRYARLSSCSPAAHAPSFPAPPAVSAPGDGLEGGVGGQGHARGL